MCLSALVDGYDGLVRLRERLPDLKPDKRRCPIGPGALNDVAVVGERGSSSDDHVRDVRNAANFRRIPRSAVDDRPHPVVYHAAGYFGVYVGIPVRDFTEHRPEITLDGECD